MKKILTTLVLTTFLFAIFVLPSNAVLLTSNTIANSDVIDFSQFVGNEYSAFQGPVQIGDLVGSNVTITGDPYSGSNGAWLWNSSWGLTGNGTWNSGRAGFAGYAWGNMLGTVYFHFEGAPVSEVGAFINDAPGMGDFIISAYDVNWNLLESYDIWAMAPISTPGGTNAGAFRGISLNDPLISHFGVSGYVPVVDDLTFSSTANPVPEPGTVLLLGLGMVGLAGYGRKFKKA